MASWNFGHNEDVPEEFGSLFLESESEDEDTEEEFLEDLELDEQVDVAYVDFEYVEPAPEYVESPMTLLGLYNQEGEEIPLGLGQSHPKARSSPANKSPPQTSPSLSDPMEIDTSGPREMQPPSPSRASVSPTLAEDAENADELVEVCIIVGEEDFIPLDGDDFHLADEHHTFQQVIERPSVKGHLSFRQYIKTKAAKFGVKTFELCESSTGYLWSFFVYVGGATTYDPTYPSTLQKSTLTVLTLVRPLLDKGYTLFMDNWYNSPLLARFLKSHKTDCVGTLRTNRSHVPPLISLCQLKEGQFVARHSGDVVIMAYQDKKRKIGTISTYHGIQQDLMEPKQHREAQYKPKLILDYNKSMGGVDRKDQMLEPYLLERKKCSKWSMKVFKRLLNCSILNARIHYEASTRTSKNHLVFRLELVQQIMQYHHSQIPNNTRRPVRGPSTASTSGHLPSYNDPLPNGRRARRRCSRCSQNGVRRTTVYMCTNCDVPLCIEPCFKLYHHNVANP